MENFWEESVLKYFVIQFVRNISFKNNKQPEKEKRVRSRAGLPKQWLLIDLLLQDIDDDGERGGANSQFNNNDDPEYFAYECLSVRDTEKLFQDEILALSEAIKVREI